MVTALNFFLLFFTENIIGDIVKHTNTYAWGHVAQTSYVPPTPIQMVVGMPPTMKRSKGLFALLIYFGLVKVGGECSNYWSTKTLHNGLWARDGLGYDVVMKLMDPLFDQGYLYVDNFYSSLTLFKDLFARGTGATGTIMETRRDFPANLKNSKQWAKGKPRGSMRWERDGPCLALQWIDNKVVSLLTTTENANDQTTATRKTKTAGVWDSVQVSQPGTVAKYNNKYMNAVDRSDQILTCQTVLRKCLRWWKTLFFHLIDVAVVNSFILFKAHQKQFPDKEALRRPSSYDLVKFREEIVRQLCGFLEYGNSPLLSSPLPPPPPSAFVTEHMLMMVEVKKR